MKSLDEIKESISKLPAEERAELMEWMELRGEGRDDADWKAEWQTEVEKRLKQWDGTGGNPREATEVHAELRAKHGL